MKKIFLIAPVLFVSTILVAGSGGAKSKGEEASVASEKTQGETVSKPQRMTNENPKFEFECPMDWVCEISSTSTAKIQRPSAATRQLATEPLPMTGAGAAAFAEQMAYQTMQDSIQSEMQKQLLKQSPQYASIYFQSKAKDNPASMTIQINESMMAIHIPSFNCGMMMTPNPNDPDGCQMVECRSIKWGDRKVQAMTTRCPTSEDKKEWNYSMSAYMTRGNLTFNLSGDVTTQKKTKDCPDDLKLARDSVLKSFVIGK